MNEIEQFSIIFNNRKIFTTGCPEITLSNGAIIKGKNWVKHQDHFRSETIEFVCDLLVNMQLNNCILFFLITFKQPVLIQSCTIPQQILLEQTNLLDRNYLWQPLKKGIYIDSLTPTILTGKINRYSVSLAIHYHNSLFVNDDQNKFALQIDNRTTYPKLHYPTYYSANISNYYAKKNSQFCAKLNLSFEETDQKLMFPPIPWRFPGGKKACFVITDHADWDTTKKIDALYSSSEMINSQLKTTKSVFYRTKHFKYLSKTFNPEGLDVPDFLKAIDALHETGHEICPHSITPYNSVSQDIVREALSYFAENYASGTWIDHGYAQLYNYSRLGWDINSEWYLLDELKKSGFNNMWSFIDVTEYPVRSINQLAYSDTSKDYIRAFYLHLLQGNMWAAVNYLKVLAKQQLGKEGKNQIKNFAYLLKLIISTEYKPDEKYKRISKKITELPYMLSVLLYSLIFEKNETYNFYPVFSNEKGLSIRQISEEDLILFTSVLVNNGAIAWQNLDKLIEEHGIHIAHTYLCNTNLKYGNSTLINKNGHWVLSDWFKERLTIMGEKITNGDIWNPTMKDCVTWFKKWSKITIEYMGNSKILIHNPSVTPIKNYGIMFTVEPEEVRSNGQILEPVDDKLFIYCMDIQGGEALIVDWVY